MILEARFGINLRTIAGNWTQSDFGYIWTIASTGTAFLDGQHRGAEYDLAEQGEGMQMSISRLDGWKIDLEKSTTSHLFWTKPGEPELEWVRVENLDKLIANMHRAA